MTDLKTRLENVGKKMAEDDCLRSYSIALSGIVVELAEVLGDIVEIEERMQTDTRKSFLQEDCEKALAKLEAFLDKADGK